jgi:hypothetical protein
MFDDEPEQSTWYPLGSHRHSSGYSISTLAGRITSRNQNMTAGVANSSDTNTTVNLDGMARFCNMHIIHNLV